MNKIKTEEIYEDFSKDKEMFDFSNYSTKSKYHDDLEKLVNGEIKDEIGGFAIEKFVGLLNTSKLFLYSPKPGSLSENELLEKSLKLLQ